MAGPEGATTAQMVTCWDCDPPTEWEPHRINGHRNKHRNKPARGDSSSVPAGDRVNEAGEMTQPGADLPPETIHVERPVVVSRPKVADGLTPWLALAGMAVYNRNHYDGVVFQRGTPGLISALDDVAQENDALYRFLEGVKKGDSPNFRLALACLAIIVPVLANHRPDSKMLRNAVGGLSLIPGTNIPPLPKPADVSQEEYDATQTVVRGMREMVETLTPEQGEAMAQALTEIPGDVLEKLGDMVTAQTVPSTMTNPATLGDEAVVDDAETSGT